jgi:hypothetical protein
MKLVKEHLLEFERGLDPKDVLGIGKRYLIEKWLKDHNIKYYYINKNLIIDVHGVVNLEHRKIGNLPEYIQFGKVAGFFDCADNNMTSLRGCPKYVEGYFACDHNNLKTLDGCPKRVDGTFHCNVNKTKFTEDYVRSLCVVKQEVEDYRG